jgi:LytS/YehU family sensor histidine kinase
MPIEFGWAFITSQVIGLCIMAASWAVLAVRPQLPRLIASLVAIPTGAGAAIGLIALAGSGPVAEQIAEHPRVFASMLGGALVFGAAVSYYFHAAERISAGETRLREELLERVLGEQRLTQANLKLLQAQIEPHFLFNTLSNILHLIEEQPADARRMLENLTAYLRASLQRTRAGPTTLGEELELVRAYLEIQAVRLGDRLRWEIQAAPEVRHLELPPLLLQPLVENAVRHGLEPKPGGGAISVRARREGGQLLLDVIDTGLGMSETSPPGVGLSNVRSRVGQVSAGRGELTLRPNRPAGLCASISLPVADPSAAPAA